MFNRERLIPSGPPTVLLVLLAVTGGAAALGLLLNRSSLDLRYLVALPLALAAVMILMMPTERVLRIGFALLTVSFGFGWRTIHLTSALSLHPTEVLVWLLFIGLLIRGLTRSERLRFDIPFLALGFVALALMGLVSAFLLKHSPDAALSEFKVYLAIVPSYYVVQWMVRNRNEWTQTTRWCVLVGAYIGLLAVLDYFLPSFSLALSGNTQLDTSIYTGDEAFQRVGFLFYGSYLGAFVIFMFFAFGLGWLIDSWEAGDYRMTAFSALAVALMAMGMYLSGFRGLWYAVLGFSILLMFLFRRARVLIILPLAGLPLLPAAFFLRFESLFVVEYADSSFFKRVDRAQIALSQIRVSPLAGNGLAGAGYVHSDLLQIAASFGLPALLVFLLLMGSGIWRLFGLVARPGWIGRYAGLLFAYLCAQMIIFAGEGLIVWAQIMIPFWFMWAMVLKLIEFAHAEAATAPPGALAHVMPVVTSLGESST